MNTDECAALQEYLSLPVGTLTFQAQATDLAGNVEAAAGDSFNTRTWTVALPSPYAIITGRHLPHIDLCTAHGTWSKCAWCPAMQISGLCVTICVCQGHNLTA